MACQCSWNGSQLAIVVRATNHLFTTIGEADRFYNAYPIASLRKHPDQLAPKSAFRYWRFLESEVATSKFDNIAH